MRSPPVALFLAVVPIYFGVQTERLRPRGERNDGQESRTGENQDELSFGRGKGARATHGCSPHAPTAASKDPGAGEVGKRLD